jgi:hypothetical protein
VIAVADLLVEQRDLVRPSARKYKRLRAGSDTPTDCPALKLRSVTVVATTAVPLRSRISR